MLWHASFLYYPQGMCLDEAIPLNQGAVLAQGVECLVIFLDVYGSPVWSRQA